MIQTVAARNREVEWVGPHSPVTVAHVLRRIAFEQRTGDLQVVSGNRIKTIHVNRGAVRFAASNLRDDRLGETMVARERLSRDDYQRASLRMKQEHCRFGEALIRMGNVTEQQLNLHLAVQVQRIVLSLFQFQDGLYSFDEKNNSANIDFRIDLSMHSMLLKGIRRINDGKVILSGLPHADTVLRISPHPPMRIGASSLTGIERAILARAAERVPLRTIVRDRKLNRTEALRACLALWAAGLIEEDETEKMPSPSVTRSIDAPTSEGILDRYRRLDRETDEEVLGLASSADEKQLREVYRLQRKKWAETRDRVGAGSPLADKVARIELRLANAFHHLLSERGSDPTVAFEERPRSSPLEPTESPSPAESEQAAPAPTSEREIHVRKLERDLKWHFQAEDWNGAISILHELTIIEPTNARYRGLIAKAMTRHPRLTRNAEQHFLEALKLSPEDAELHLSLGRYYLTSGRDQQARTQFKTVLKLDPENETARRHLRSSAKKPRSIFSGLFS